MTTGKERLAETHVAAVLAGVGVGVGVGVEVGVGVVAVDDAAGFDEVDVDEVAGWLIVIG